MAVRMTSVGQRCRANGVYVRIVNVRRHAWQRKRWRPTGRRPSFFTLAEWQRGQCGILIPSQRKQYQQRGASLAHCNFAGSFYVVAPGYVETDMAEPLLSGPEGEGIRSQSPLG